MAKGRQFRTTVISLSLMLPQAALADGDAEKPKVSFEGTLYTNWSMDLTEGSELANEFSLDRLYLTAKGRPHKKLELRLTTDVGREKTQSIEIVDAAGVATEIDVPEDTALRPFVKYAWLEWKDAMPGVKLRFGAIDTPFPGYYDTFWGHRFASKALTDEAGILNTADLGVSAIGSHKYGMLGWHLSATNGPGYKKPEEDRTKAVQLRVTVDPLAPKEGDNSLPISGFVSYEPTQDGDPRLVALGAVGVSVPNLLVWGEGLTTRDGTTGIGASATVMPRHADLGDLYLRVDWYDADTDVDDDATTRLIGGVSHRFADKVVQGAVQFDQVVAQATPDVPERVASLRLDAGF